MSDDEVVAVLRYLRFLAATDLKAFRRLLSWDQDTRRWYFEGLPMDRNNKLTEPLANIDFTAKKNIDLMVFLVLKAEEFHEARPTLLRLGAEFWCDQVVARQQNQRDLRRAAIRAVTLRAASEETDNVLMSRDSLAKMIELMTGRTPGVAPMQRLYAWFASGNSPFEVIRKGQRGKFGQSTTLRVRMPELPEWKVCLDPAEQELTRQWLADSDQVLGELYADEARRKADRPELKSRYARACEIREQMARFDEEAVFLFASLNSGNVKATSLSNLIAIDEKTDCLGLEQGPVPPLPWEREEPRSVGEWLAEGLDLGFAPVPDWYERRRQMLASDQLDFAAITVDLDLAIPAAPMLAETLAIPEPVSR